MEIVLIVGAIILAIWVWNKFIRNRCTECKSTNYQETDKKHLKSWKKREKTGTSGGNPVYTTKQYDKYLVNYKCNDCNNTWQKDEEESVVVNKEGGL